MKNLVLIEPELKDYWYEKQILSGEKTMSYNAGYDVSYAGYNYNTGCIDFPESRWEDNFRKRQSKDIFFAYIFDKDIDKFVGTVDYSKNEDRYDCGIVIEDKYRGKGYSKEALKLLCEKALKNGVDKLYDNFEINRGNTLQIFESVGFKVVKKETWKKFGKDVDGVLVCIDLNNIIKK